MREIRERMSGNICRGAPIPTLGANELVGPVHRNQRARRDEAATIPIVMVTTGDPVQGGLVESLARPGGNVTGVTALGQALNIKRLEIVKEALPALKRVAVLINPDRPTPSRSSRSAKLRLGFGIEVRN